MPKKKKTQVEEIQIEPQTVPGIKEQEGPKVEEPKEEPELIDVSPLSPNELPKDKPKKEREPMTTTKKILWLTWITFIVLIGLQIAGMDMGVPLEVVGGTMTTIITATYLWKSKAENKLKITISAMDSLADKYGIENVIPLVQEIVDD